MHISGVSLKDIFENNPLLVMPIYQRRYSWGEEQCQTLINDLLRISESKRAHFIGSIVLVEDEGLHTLKGLKQTQVIDGQQRLTTIYLLYLAIYHSIQSLDTKDDALIEDLSNLKSYIYTQNFEDPRLFPTKFDREALMKIVDSSKSVVNVSSKHNLVKMYNFFKKHLEEKPVNVYPLLQGLKQLKFAQIVLDLEDDPQATFESLNATGKSLSDSDLIQNFIFMGIQLPEQERLYEKYWFNIYEEAIDFEEKIEHFLTTFLELKTYEPLRGSSLYEEFKKYCRENYSSYGSLTRKSSDLEDLLKELSFYWDYYKTVKKKSHKLGVLNDCYQIFETLNVDKMRPFLIELTIAYNDSRLDLKDFKEICSLLESYIFRRTICVKGDKQKYPVIVLSLIKQIVEHKSTESIKNAIFKKFLEISTEGGVHTFPNNTDFKECLTKYRLYPNRKIANYVLEKLSNNSSKEPIKGADFEIEHIMPETLDDIWKGELAQHGENWLEIHEIYKDTLGNLTFLVKGANASVSNKSFCEKKEMKDGYNDSNLWLNQSLKTFETWNEEAILKRAEQLAEVSCMSIWRYPEELRNFKAYSNRENCTDELSLNEKWQGKDILGYSFLHEECHFNDLGSVFEHFCSRIVKIDSDILKKHTLKKVDSSEPQVFYLYTSNSMGLKQISGTNYGYSPKCLNDEYRLIIKDLMELTPFKSSEFYLLTKKEVGSIHFDMKYIMLSDDWTGLKFQGFNLLGESKEVGTCVELLMGIVEILYNHSDDEVFNKYLESHSAKGRVPISKDPSNFKNPKKISSSDYYIETNTSSNDKRDLILKLLEVNHVSQDNLVIMGNLKEE